MSPVSLITRTALFLAASLAGCATPQPAAPLVQPPVQQGKDVMFIPQPADLVEKMMDFAAVTPQDLVMDLGSGDGRNIIAAAKRGAKAVGVEFNPALAAYSRRAAAAAGVSDRARFVEGDMYEADISQATALTLFLIPVNLQKLTPRFLSMRPGSRIVINTYPIPEWQPDETRKDTQECMVWCELFLYIVPAQVAGTWKLTGPGTQGELRLEQQFQMLTGTLTSGGQSLPIHGGRLRGDRIVFRIGDVAYEGTVDGDSIRGLTADGAAWTAARS